MTVSPEHHRGSPPPVDLAALLRRACGGDQDAFAAMHDATAARVFGLAFRLIRDREQAEEVAQEVYVQLWRNSCAFDRKRGGAVSWVLMHTHSAAVARVRTEGSRTTREHRHARRDWALHAASPDPTPDLVDVGLPIARVRGAVARLSAKQRQALELAYFDGYTYREVAQRLDTPLGTTKSRIRDGLLALRVLLDDQPGLP